MVMSRAAGCASHLPQTATNGFPNFWVTCNDLVGWAPVGHPPPNVLFFAHCWKPLRHIAGLFHRVEPDPPPPEAHRLWRERVQGNGSEWRSASSRRQLQTRTTHHGVMPNPPPKDRTCMFLLMLPLLLTAQTGCCWSVGRFGAGVRGMSSFFVHRSLLFWRLSTTVCSVGREKLFGRSLDNK